MFTILALSFLAISTKQPIQLTEMSLVLQVFGHKHNVRTNNLLTVHPEGHMNVCEQLLKCFIKKYAIVALKEQRITSVSSIQLNTNVELLRLKQRTDEVVPYCLLFYPNGANKTLFPVMSPAPNPSYIPPSSATETSLNSEKADSAV